MRALEASKTYDSKIQFNIVYNNEPRFDAEIEQYEFETHGLLGLGPDGTVVTKIEGHEFGKDEVVEAINKLLAS